MIFFYLNMLELCLNYIEFASKSFTWSRTKSIRHRTNPTWIYFINECFSIFLISHLSLFSSAMFCEFIFKPEWFMRKKERKMKKHKEMSKGDVQAETNSQNCFPIFNLIAKGWEVFRLIFRQNITVPVKEEKKLQLSNFTVICRGFCAKPNIKWNLLEKQQN